MIDARVAPKRILGLLLTTNMPSCVEALVYQSNNLTSFVAFLACKLSESEREFQINLLIALHLSLLNEVRPSVSGSHFGTLERAYMTILPSAVAQHPSIQFEVVWE